MGDRLGGGYEVGRLIFLFSLPTTWDLFSLIPSEISLANPLLSCTVPGIVGALALWSCSVACPLLALPPPISNVSTSAVVPEARCGQAGDAGLFSLADPVSRLLPDNLSYIEHIFEISRRPDLLTMVVDYRTRVLKISEEEELDTKLTRIPSAKKYKGRRRALNTHLCPLPWVTLGALDLGQMGADVGGWPAVSHAFCARTHPFLPPRHYPAALRGGDHQTGSATEESLSEGRRGGRSDLQRTTPFPQPPGEGQGPPPSLPTY